MIHDQLFSEHVRHTYGSPAVLKFGSSSLKSAEDVKRVATYVRALCISGIKCAVVVSALHGETDRLLLEAHRLAPNPCHSILPRHVLHGEEQSASALTLALIAAGVSASAMSVADLELIAAGHPLEAVPIAVRGDIARRLNHHDAVVVPGFGGWCEERGQAVLLGRGGSDLTAVHVARAIRSDEVVLIKDVDGIYSADPKDDPEALHFDALSFDEARTISGKVVQGAAIDAAEQFGISIIIRSMTGKRESRISAPRQGGDMQSKCAA